VMGMHRVDRIENISVITTNCSSWIGGDSSELSRDGSRKDDIVRQMKLLSEWIFFRLIKK
jgi:hypothetical protein